MGSGGGSGGGGSSGQTSSASSTSTPNLYSWKDILPPWVQSGQQTVLPWLMSRAQEGLLPSEERTLWSQAKSSIEDSSMQANRNFSRQLASSGLSPSSPMVVGGYADLGMDKMTTTSKAALDFAKMKMGAKDTAIGQLLTALYTPPPVAVGQTTTSTQSSAPYQSPGSSSGGGK